MPCTSKLGARAAKPQPNTKTNRDWIELELSLVPFPIGYAMWLMPSLITIVRRT